MRPFSGPTISAAGRFWSGTLVVKGEIPTIDFVVAVGDSVVARPRVPGDPDQPELRGPAVDLVEGLSLQFPTGPRSRPRGPLADRRIGPGLLTDALRFAATGSKALKAKMAISANRGPSISALSATPATLPKGGENRAELHGEGARNLHGLLD